MFSSRTTSGAWPFHKLQVRCGPLLSGLLGTALILPPPLGAADGGQQTCQPRISGQELSVSSSGTASALAAPQLVCPGQVRGEVPAEGPQTPGDSSQYDLYEALNLLRAGGEACAFGAATGVVSVMVTTAQVGNGLWTPGIFDIALGAAGFGCALGFVGATAAKGFNYLWERGVDQYLHYFLGDQPVEPQQPSQPPTPP